MRKDPSNQSTILDLLEKGKRNLHGVELRTLSKEGNIDPVEFSSHDLKKITSLLQQIQSSLSVLEERFVPQYVKEPVQRHREKKIYSAVEKYMRKHK